MSYKPCDTCIQIPSSIEISSQKIFWYLWETLSWLILDGRSTLIKEETRFVAHLTILHLKWSKVRHTIHQSTSGKSGYWLMNSQSDIHPLRPTHTTKRTIRSLTLRLFFLNILPLNSESSFENVSIKDHRKEWKLNNVLIKSSFWIISMNNFNLINDHWFFFSILISILIPTKSG